MNMAKRSRRDPVETLKNEKLVCTRTELDIFTPPKKQDMILGYQDVTFTPMSSIQNNGPLNFEIPANESLFTDLAQITLALEVTVTHANGNSVQKISEEDSSTTAVEEVSVPNDFFDCLFKKISLWINATKTGSEHNHHAQVSVIRTIASYPSSVASVNLKDTIIWQVRVEIKQMVFFG